MCGVGMLFVGGLIGVIAVRANEDIDPDAATAVGIASTIVIIFGIVALVICVLMVVAGIGVLKRAKWGRVLTLVLGGICGVLAILCLVSVLTGQGGRIGNVLFYGGYCTTVFVLLLNPRFASEFG